MDPAPREGVDWPIQPVEIQRRFVPRFCPWRECPNHHLTSTASFPFSPHGVYVRSDGRRVARYRCRHCRRTFSKQSFSVTYFLKRPELLVPICAGLQAGSAHRQLARSLGCAASTVTRLSARLGRHALLLLARALLELGVLSEELVCDHFEGFVRCQDYAVGIASVVGRESWFVYGLDPAPHSGPGRRSPIQEARRRTRPAQPTRGGHEGSFRRVIEALVHFFPDCVSVRLVTDGHEAYVRAIAGSAHRWRFVHRVFPNPERGPKGSPRSEQARERDEAMFPNDLLHMLVRHSAAHHRRETIAFGRRTAAVMERMFLLAAWRNFVKGVSERKADRTTPAMRLGLTNAPWPWPRVLARRLFPERVSIPRCWRWIYRREWVTPGGPNPPHELRLAY